MMRRLVLHALILALGGVGVWSFLRAPHQVTLHSATAHQTGADGTYMITLTIENAGPPETLENVASPGADMAMVMGATGPLVIPSGGSASFAMDGAHVMVRGGEGGFVPLTLVFASGAEVSTRAKVADGMAMDHSMENGAQVTPAPTLSISMDGMVLKLQTTDFALVRAYDDAPHVPGEGHAHVYLNGLKLGRLYEDSMAIGALAAGDYTLTVALNTHDHRPYLDSGQPISETITFTVP